MSFRFYQAPAKEYNKYDFQDIYCFNINQIKSDIYFIVIEKEQTVDLPFDQVQLPESGLDQIEQEIKNNPDLRDKVKEKEMSKKQLKERKEAKEELKFDQ